MDRSTPSFTSALSWSLIPLPGSHDPGSSLRCRTSSCKEQMRTLRSVARLCLVLFQQRPFPSWTPLGSSAVMIRLGKQWSAWVGMAWALGILLEAYSQASAKRLEDMLTLVTGKDSPRRSSTSLESPDMEATGCPASLVVKDSSRLEPVSRLSCSCGVEQADGPGIPTELARYAKARFAGFIAGVISTLRQLADAATGVVGGLSQLLIPPPPLSNTERSIIRRERTQG